MNLADAIRKAANKAPGEGPATEQFKWPEPMAAAVPQESPVNNSNQTAREYSHVPEPPQSAVMSGNAIRLEIFLSGEQMSGMLKAIMAGQHSVLTVREAASYLRISPSRLEKLVDEGEIPAVEIDGRYRFPKSNLDDWLASQSAANEEEKDVA